MSRTCDTDRQSLCFARMSTRTSVQQQLPRKKRVFRHSARKPLVDELKQNKSPGKVLLERLSCSKLCVQDTNILNGYALESESCAKLKGKSPLSSAHPFFSITDQSLCIDSLRTPLSDCRVTRSLSVWAGSLTKSRLVDQLNSVCLSDFTKIRYLGKGKFGEVSLVRHDATGFVCAMKVINKAIVRQEKVQHQISRQLKIHNTLRHLNIISFYGFFSDESCFYMLMEYATGGDLYSRLKQLGRLEEPLVQPIVRDVCEGLKMIHNMGFIHRDLKPENIIFQFGNVKICDLGWAASCSEQQTRKSYCGTPLYLSPEMVQKESYNGQSDVWAIGVLTYELLVGRIPFSIWSELDLQLIVNQEVIFPDYVDISQDGKDFITKCLSKKQEERIRLHELRMHSFLDSYQASSFSTEVYDALEATF